MEINRRIAYLLRFKGLDQKSFAKEIGIAPASLNKVVKEKAPAGAKVITGVLNAFDDISAEWLLRGEGEMLRAKNSGNDIKKELKDIKSRIENIESKLK